MKKMLLLVACLFVGSANAALISVSSVTASSTFFSYDVNNLINGNGLSGSMHSGDFNTKWMSGSSVAENLTFDLGSVFDISSSSIWNYGNGCCDAERSVKDLSVEGSIDGISYSAIGGFTLSQSVGLPFAGETIALVTTAQYIRFNLDSNYGGFAYGLSEVQFDGVVPVPEPASLALLGLGLAGIGFSRKRNKAT